MQLPYRRPRLLEFHDQPWCPPVLRQHIQALLTLLWVHRIPPFQSRAPYELASDHLEQVVREIEDSHGSSSPAEKSNAPRGRIRVVDCCSGAGGPMPSIERRVNARRAAEGRPLLQVLLSDLHPHLPAWTKHACATPNSALFFLPYSVDATHAPSEVRKGRHIRTFCLSFHHFGEEGARRVLEDAMRTAEGIVIFELQEPDFGSIVTILALFPLVLLLTPFMRPPLIILFFTYIVPIIPLIFVFDGLVSAWRTRSLAHIRYLANLAQLTLSLEGSDKDGVKWKWSEVRATHTRPFAKMFAITGRKVAPAVLDAEGDSTDWTDGGDEGYHDAREVGETDDEQ